MLADEVPDGTEFLSAAANEGTCAEPEGSDPQDDVTCNLNAIAPDDEAAVTLRVRADGTQGTVTNVARVTSQDTEVESNSVTTTVVGADIDNREDDEAGEDQYREEREDDSPNDVVDENDDEDNDRDNIVNVPGKDLPDTGGPPLLGVAFFVLAGAGLLTAVVRRRY